jgi:tRNA threonylcarbamoyladenosine biosynthesis protein TsaE
MELQLGYAGAGRQASLRACTARGERLLARLAKC